jgi:hypothetical protein
MSTLVAPNVTASEPSRPVVSWAALGEMPQHGSKGSRSFAIRARMTGPGCSLRPRGRPHRRRARRARHRRGSTPHRPRPAGRRPRSPRPRRSRSPRTTARDRSPTLHTSTLGQPLERAPDGGRARACRPIRLDPGARATPCRRQLRTSKQRPDARPRDAEAELGLATERRQARSMKDLLKGISVAS